eukprot:TRINITY_DN1242_c0_g2_i2.p1 TRINITY_DN1242_c0_g2~~TRINITY_DN1242_c0_g2_i2.p1  ORF type:complete len:275 (+),score=46.76 TRINITY_DN1242_c0_g2_i2:43-825(+)
MHRLEHRRVIDVGVIVVLLILLSSTWETTLTFASASSAVPSLERTSIKSLKLGWNNLTGVYNNAPPARVFAASSGDAPVPPPYPPWSSDGLVIFGGAGSSTTYSPLFNDVWVLNPLDNEEDGRAWTQIPIIPSLPSPQPRCLSAAAVDSEGVLYIFGGFDGHNWYNDFWRLNLSVIHTPGENVGWKELPVHDQWPSPVCGHSMLWSVDMRSLILFGGGYDYKTVYDDVWVGTESGWEKLEMTSEVPPAREVSQPIAHHYC